MTKIVAHRGNPWAEVENTLAAFTSALDLGVDVVELDARVSADGEVVVIHDETLARLWGVPERVADTDWATIRQLRVGTATIPLLAEALDLFADGDTQVMVDLPSAYGIDKIIAVVAAHQARGQVVWSGEPEALEFVRAAEPEAVIYSHRFGTELAPTMIKLDGTALTLAEVERAHAEGLGLSVWTIDDAATMRRLLAAGVDSLTTNRPELALQI